MEYVLKHPISLKKTSCEPKLFVISAPAGAGKTTLIQKMESAYSQSLEKVVTSTSRAAREGEVHGKDYYFLSREEFEKEIRKESFLEWVFLFRNYYGIGKGEIDRIFALGKHAIAVIDIQGALKIKTLMPAVSIFIAPPSMEELHRRLEERGSETDEQIAERLARSSEEIKAASQFDYIVINDNLNQAYQSLVDVFIAEENRSRHEQRNFNK
ncbi:guanylate kinase [Chlamydiifrater phoenicopteri]|uniref:guanylate kinase n=1 Tax=Chlamydiifrater phoenicopteri TaxID=2681469 RepID=UPI001BCD2174|nr:guanylate kinase [Chlamydiifrater phoenicopteri]